MGVRPSGVRYLADGSSAVWRVVPAAAGVPQSGDTAALVGPDVGVSPSGPAVHPQDRPSVCEASGDGIPRGQVRE